MKQLKIKCWIEEEGEKYYGPGPHELLNQIQKEGSLSKAAGKMHMSYKKAWAMVQKLNQFSAEALVILKKGGQDGGGAEVSLYGLEIMKEYDDLQLKVGQLTVQEEKSLKILK
tara:strand:+ start:2134 stop:2472 length:339 start_codon:yes stop_codon:yes gene_type:complete